MDPRSDEPKQDYLYFVFSSPNSLTKFAGREGLDVHTNYMVHGLFSRNVTKYSLNSVICFDDHSKLVDVCRSDRPGGHASSTWWTAAIAI